MPVLDDGTIVPSFLNVDGQLSRFDHSVNDLVLRVGTVVAAYDPTNTLNHNQKYTEYDVVVDHANQDSGYTSVTYPRCRIASLFGGIADFLRWTPRIDSQSGQGGVNLGSTVFLLCVNGNNRRAFIVGGFPHSQQTLQDPPFSQSPYLTFQYNGINAKVNQNGEFLLTRNGATDISGKVLNTNNTMQVLNMTNDGKITIGYDPSIGDKPNIVWDQASNTIIIHGMSKVRIESSGGPCEISTGSGVKINGATEAFIRGTTYRNSQFQLNSQLLTALTGLSTQLSIVATALTGMSVALKPPVIGCTLGSVPCNVAAVAMTAAVPMVTQMITAINTFEANAQGYLSHKHFHDD